MTSKHKCDPRELPDLIIRPIVTEKATILLEQNKYVFDVAKKASKPQIKAAIESLFDVTVTKVNTLNRPPKKRRVGRFIGYKPRYKRAIVTLAEGDSITLFPEV
ncbi:MAG: 50S ribosomal protein L23 [Oscillatoria sp. PMC 1051.18]|uniref:50S ribosomal protein L23 n=1 Tax=Oscillatoria salina TaxID=331517 RepID=UPI0013B5D816|nr:50S ribosomal protein L23 [Oscillatoria salina]MBZ8179712.1 50S ribosomal protein L23 [Oscillatoria salina IIICB1]MEC4893845.1 50S ribosomal protein L23 [Oscillatoria sp. PMC 1050.18]MEC5029216.1 50S ribosomal protein L23 [Oscillatoria sp. PMC 1051.18]NET87186.1 50S ribosomal protein L23 [Kamptonema sp. SIO1D9]